MSPIPAANAIVFRVGVPIVGPSAFATASTLFEKRGADHGLVRAIDALYRPITLVRDTCAPGARAHPNCETHRDPPAFGNAESTRSKKGTLKVGLAAICNGKGARRNRLAPLCARHGAWRGRAIRLAVVASR